MHPLLSFNATYTGIMVSYGFYHKHQGWAFSFLYIRSVASSILFYVTFYLFGWEDRNGLVPVYFKGQMSSDILQDLVCTCKGKSVCMKGCICFEQSLSCTDLCPCQAGDLCRNENTHLAISRNTDKR